MIQKYLILPHLKVHNANAFSSPITIGFPAITSFLGFVHALQRKITQNEELALILFSGVAIVSQGFLLHTYKGLNSFESHIIGTSNPLDRTGKRTSFIAEPRCDMEISLIIECEGISKKIEDELIFKIVHHLNASMKIAGGDIISFSPPRVEVIETSNHSEIKRLARSMMPGFILAERRELIKYDMNRGKDALTSLIDHLAVHYTSSIDENEVVTWTSSRKGSGWIIPIATGFQGISELEVAKYQRDETTPHRFAESVITLGEFIMLHKINTIEEVLWKYSFNQEENLYVCQTN